MGQWRQQHIVCEKQIKTCFGLQSISVFHGDAFFCSLPCDGLDFREMSYIGFFYKINVIIIQIIYCCSLPGRHQRKKASSADVTQETNVCVFRKQPALFFQHRRFTCVYFVGCSWYHRYNCGESAQSEHKTNPNDGRKITTAA